MFYLGSENPYRRGAQQSLRERNIQRLFNIISQSGQTTRADLVRRSGLSPSTVSSLVADLVRADLVRELGLAQPSSASGRRPILLSVHPGGRQLPVFSLGDFGVSYKLYDLEYNALDDVFRPFLSDAVGGDWQTLFRDAGEDYAAIIAEILEKQSPHFDRSHAPALLISYPGIYLEQERRFLLTATNTSFRLGALKALERRVGLPVFIGNSSASLAYAEKKQLDGAGHPEDELIYVNVCGGVGAGIISRRDGLMKPGRIAGEIGHMTIQTDGRPCPCGNRGCLEQYVNIRAIISEVRKSVAADASGMHAEALRQLLSDTTLERIGAAYAQGIPSVRQAMDRVTRWLAAGIYSVVNVTGIRCIILGGIEALGEEFLDALRQCVSGSPARFLMRNVAVMYQHIRPEDEGRGIAQYFIDKVWSMAEDNPPFFPAEQ